MSRKRPYSARRHDLNRSSRSSVCFHLAPQVWQTKVVVMIFERMNGLTVSRPTSRSP